MKRGQLPAGVDARLAAIGLDAMLYGLISKWLADRDYFALARRAEAVVDLYLEGLRRNSRRPVRVRERTKARPKR